MNINEMLNGSLFFGFFLSLFCYWAASKIARRFPYTILNPLLLSAIFIIAILAVFHIDYDTYNEGAQYLSYLLTPATICLAVPMYRQIQVLKTHFVAIFFSMLAGSADLSCPAAQVHHDSHCHRSGRRSGSQQYDYGGSCHFYRIDRSHRREEFLPPA